MISELLMNGITIELNSSPEALIKVKNQSTQQV